MLEPNSYFWKQYLTIKHWPSWLGFFTLRLIILLPYHFQLKIGRIIGNIFYQFAGYRRIIAYTNINLCFPDWSEDKKQLIIKKHFQALGMAIIDTAMNWWGDKQKLIPYTDFKGIDYLHQKLAQGHNIILLSFHFTSLESASQLFMEQQPFAVTYQQMRNPVFNHLMIRARGKNVKKAIERRDIRTMIRTIKEKVPMWIAADQDLGAKNSVFVPFFGHMAATQSSPMKLSKLSNAMVLPLFTRRINGKIIVEILPALENFPSLDMENDALRLNQLLEQYIIECPEQYLWIHRKFKTRPNQETKIYPAKPRRIKKKKSML